MNKPLRIPWKDAEYIIYRDPWRESDAATNDHALSAHIATPAFMLSPRSLFQLNDRFILCGSGGGETVVKRSGYVRACDGYGIYGVERHKTLPEGYKICTYCLHRLITEFLPFADDEQLL